MKKISLFFVTSLIGSVALAFPTLVPYDFDLSDIKSCEVKIDIDKRLVDSGITWWNKDRISSVYIVAKDAQGKEVMYFGNEVGKPFANKPEADKVLERLVDEGLCK